MGVGIFSSFRSVHTDPIAFYPPVNASTKLPAYLRLGVLASFLQLLQEYVDIGDEIESGGRVEIGFELSEEIRTIENLGFMIFGTREKRRMKFGKVVSDWDVAVIRILRSTNPQINKIDLQNQMVDR